jgi:hypothetical protein
MLLSTFLTGAIFYINTTLLYSSTMMQTTQAHPLNMPLLLPTNVPLRQLRAIMLSSWLEPDGQLQPRDQLAESA